MSYLEHFNNQARADLHLIAHTHEGCKCSNPIVCKSFYLHETYLFSGSRYFRTLLETAVGGLATEMSTVGKLRTITILHDYIEEGEMEAVEFVLKSFYDKGEPPLDTLPSEIDAKVPLLLKALRVAERYQADKSKEKIAEALSSTPATQLTLDLAKTVFALPLFDMTLFSRLKVHSENDVVYLLDKWITNKKPSTDQIDYLEELQIQVNKPTPDQIDALIKEIRVINLGPAFSHQILPDLKWFKDSVLSKHHQSSAMARELVISRGEGFERRFQHLPPSWLSAPRKAFGYTPPACSAITGVLKEDELKKLYDWKAVYSEPVYHNGHGIKGCVQWQKVEREDHKKKKTSS